MNLEITFEGVPAMKKEAERLAKLYPEATGAALYQEGLNIWNHAVKNAPVEFGVLRNAAYVSPPTNLRGEVGVEIGFGTKYAVYQEATEGLNHPRGGEAHYLQRAVTAAGEGYLERLGQRIQQNAERGVRAPALGAPTTPQAGTARRRSKAAGRLRAARKGRSNGA